LLLVFIIMTVKIIQNYSVFMVMGRKTRLFSVLLTAESEKVISGGERKVGREVEREVGREEDVKKYVTKERNENRKEVRFTVTLYRHALPSRFLQYEREVKISDVLISFLRL